MPSQKKKIRRFEFAIDRGLVCSQRDDSILGSDNSYLVEVGSDPALPILAEVYEKLSAFVVFLLPVHADLKVFSVAQVAM